MIFVVGKAVASSAVVFDVAAAAAVVVDNVADVAAAAVVVAKQCGTGSGGVEVLEWQGPLRWKEI